LVLLLLMPGQLDITLHLQLLLKTVAQVGLGQQLLLLLLLLLLPAVLSIQQPQCQSMICLL
jgi:hypothetical protein